VLAALDVHTAKWIVECVTLILSESSRLTWNIAVNASAGI
jgi:hypothetical protein